VPIVARRKTILHLLVDLGLPPTAATLGRETGISARTARDMLQGRGVSGPTLDAVCRWAGRPYDELFERTEPPRMRVAS
jgi:hypothetical protein